jgi:phosphoribosylamine-glycine ligase
VKGCKVLASTKDGYQYEGILYTGTMRPDLGVVLKNARLVEKSQPGSTVINQLVILPKDLLNLTINDFEDHEASQTERSDKSTYIICYRILLVLTNGLQSDSKRTLILVHSWEISVANVN